MPRRAVPFLALAASCALLATLCRSSRVEDGRLAGCSESPAVESRALAAPASADTLVREPVEVPAVPTPSTPPPPNLFSVGRDLPSGVAAGLTEAQVQAIRLAAGMAPAKARGIILRPTQRQLHEAVWSGSLGVSEPISIELPRVKRAPGSAR